MATNPSASDATALDRQPVCHRCGSLNVDDETTDDDRERQRLNKAGCHGAWHCRDCNARWRLIKPPRI